MVFGLSKELHDINHPDKKKEARELQYFTARLPFQKENTHCALDAATASSSPLRTAAACHMSLPTLHFSAPKISKNTSWIGMKR